MNYSYPLANSKLSSVGADSYSYDAMGNITDDDALAYTWSAAALLKEVKTSGTSTVLGTYTYDASNLRTKKVAGGNTVHYVYGLGGLLYGEYDNSGAFGKEAATGSATVDLRFPGQYRDAETGLHYNWNRYYNPATGRYVSSDPIGLAGGLNTYGYVSASPVMFSDPEGLLQKCQTGISTTGGYNIGPFHHDYHCWTNSDGDRVCAGYSFDPDAEPSLWDKIRGGIDGTVVMNDDNRKNGIEETCTPDDGNKCMDLCAADVWSQLKANPPKYGLATGNYCQTIDKGVYDVCSFICASQSL